MKKVIKKYPFISFIALGCGLTLLTYIYLRFGFLGNAEGFFQSNKEIYGITGLIASICSAFVLAFIYLSEKNRKKLQQEYWHQLINNIEGHAIVCSGLKITDYNQGFMNFCGVESENIKSELINKFFTDTETINHILSGNSSKIETTFLTKRGYTLPVEIISRTISLGTFTEYKRLIIINDLSNKKQTEDQMLYLANHDQTTGLPNRNMLQKKLNEAIKSAKEDGKICGIIKMSVEFTDLENSSSWKEEDAKLYQYIADKLQKEVPSNTFCARVGDRTFAVLCEDMSDLADIRLTGQHIRRQLHKPIDMNEMTFNTNISVGLATYPENAHSPQELLKCAQIALKKAQNEGRGKCVYYTPDLHIEISRRNTLSQELEQAIQNGDIQTYFQPILHAHNETVAAFEALVRWKHPDYGLIPPIEFLDIAEHKKLMFALTESVLASSLQALKDWPDDVRVSVNISPHQLNPEMVAQIKKHLTQTGVNPERLEIEVTEDALINDFAHASSMFSSLRAMGVQVAMDDFGAGYTSLGNLRYLHFDRIKIDRIFTKDLPNHRRVAAVVRALIVLARELNISVTVEGVETKEQYEFLRQEGAHELQGYYFSPPKPLEEINKISFLKNNQNLATQKMLNEKLKQISFGMK